MKASDETQVIVRLKSTRGDMIWQWAYFILFPLVLVALSCFLVYESGYGGAAILAFVAGMRMPYYWAFTKVLVKKLFNR